MKTSILILTGLISIGHVSLYGQSSINTNSSFNTAHFLGWDSSTNFDLNIRHQGNFPIIFSTNGSERARISPDGRLFVGTTVGPNGRVVVEATGTNTVGVRSRAAGASSVNAGGWFTGNGGVVGNGATGWALNVAATRNYGVYGEACNAPNNFAIYGRACEGPDNWAGYFVGKTFCTSGMWDASDSELKTNVNPLNGATEILMALNPKSYEFVDSYSSLNLPQGLQYGLIAQELEEVIPHAVTKVYSPPQFDEEGTITEDGFEFKGVNYNQLIPVLIAGFKEQAEISGMNKSKHDELMDRLELVQSGLNMLRNSENKLPEGLRGQNNTSKKVLIENSFPNPFEHQTQIPLRVVESGLVRIDIVDAKGALIVTLKNEVLPEGEHTILWNASSMNSGVYYCVIRHGLEVRAQRLFKL